MDIDPHVIRIWPSSSRTEISSGGSCKSKPRIKCHWRREEDDILTLLVKLHGPEKWDRIAAHIPGRTGKSCRIRWINQLNPAVNKTPFSAYENRRLLELHGEFGNRWSTIASYFPFRTDNQVKNQCHILLGTRYMKASASSSNNVPHVPLMERSKCLTRSQSAAMVPVGSQITDTGPSFVGGSGSSSFYGQGETFTKIGARRSILTSLGIDSSDCGSVYPQRKLNRGNSMVSDAHSAAVEEPCPVSQPKQVGGVKEYEFIDFLGIGESE